MNLGDIIKLDVSNLEYIIEDDPKNISEQEIAGH